MLFYKYDTYYISLSWYNHMSTLVFHYYSMSKFYCIDLDMNMYLDCNRTPQSFQFQAIAKKEIFIWNILRFTKIFNKMNWVMTKVIHNYLQMPSLPTYHPPTQRRSILHIIIFSPFSVRNLVVIFKIRIVNS